jgi:hypothetical protein
MEDNRVAKQVISAIIGEEVIELDFAPQEYTCRREKSSTVYWMDFRAKIATPEGSKAVIIGMQKAELASDIIRFWRYLGGHYRDIDEKGVPPTYCIFFLGEKLGDPPSPVLEVNHYIKDVTTGEELSIESEFIKGLRHKSWIIQIPYLKKRRRTRLEQLLAIFDQDNVTHNFTSDGYMLIVHEEDFPDDCLPILRRLQQAAENPKLLDALMMEEIYLEEFRSKERENLKVLEAIEEKDKVIEAKAKKIEELKRRLES